VRKLLPLLLLLALLPLLSGCFGAGGVPINPDQLNTVRERFEELDRLDRAALEARNGELKGDIAAFAESKDKAVQADVAQKRLLLAYTWERLSAWDRGTLTNAVTVYLQLRRTPYESVALLRVVQIDESRLAREKEEGTESGAQQYRKSVVSSLEALTSYSPEAQTLRRDPPVASQVPAAWQVVPVRNTVNEWLDGYYRTTWQYQLFDSLVRLSGGRDRHSSYVIAILLIAVIAKLITTPFSIAQFRSMRALQLFQPEVKKLQEKYKDDKQQLARAQMELMKEHKVNPASSCLPMIIQMVILIQVYYGIRHFIFRFEGVPFLYLKSLANPDTVLIGGSAWPGPLLLLYAASMYFTQKLISMPATTPEQAQQQKMMAYMMPVMMLFIMKPLPAAFILYWFLQNVLMTGHQWLVMRPHRAADAAAAAAAETPPPPPPPEAIQRLSQGAKPARKKKRK
jgi:YidC/Oxa1 family membrane protein insertase